MEDPGGVCVALWTAAYLNLVIYGYPMSRALWVSAVIGIYTVILTDLLFDMVKTTVT